MSDNRPLEHANSFTRNIGRLVCWRFQTPYIYATLAAVSIFYIFVVVHTPLAIWPTGVHDDGLFISLGRYISEGRWLGPFNQFTLMKGPGYPLFLAIGNWLGIPVTFSHSLFHCFAVTFFVFVAYTFMRSFLLSATLYVLLLWHPVLITRLLQRILREQIYSGILLVALAATVYALLSDGSFKQRLFSAAIGGTALGWLWLTREEGFWIVPGFVFLIAAATMRAGQQNRLAELFAFLVVLFSLFGFIQIGFLATNWYVYGKFVGVDVKEENFQEALRAIQGVRSGGTKPFVSLTRAARQHVYSASPTFRSVAPYFDGEGRSWEKQCNHEDYQQSCGEISASDFTWALRDAAASTGQYSSSTKASDFFRDIAIEVRDACSSGRLECEPQVISVLPQWSWSQFVEKLEPNIISATKLIFLLHPPLDLNDSKGDDQLLANALRFLNYPFHSPSADAAFPLPKYLITGWYYKSGAEWISARIVHPDRSPAEAAVVRRKSPGIAESFRDPIASTQGVVLETSCLNCILLVDTQEGDRIEKNIKDLRSGDILQFQSGNGTFQIDKVELYTDPAYVPTAADRFVLAARALFIPKYALLFVPTLCLGLVALIFSCLAYKREALKNVTFIFALTAWILALSRVGLLIVSSSIWVNILNSSYVSSAYFMLAAAAILSTAAALQLLRILPSDGDRPTGSIYKARSSVSAASKKFEMNAAMTDGWFSRGRVWRTLYALMALLTLIIQIYVRAPQCSPDCALSYAKAVVWATIWPASWIVYLAGFV